VTIENLKNLMNPFPIPKKFYEIRKIRLLVRSEGYQRLKNKIILSNKTSGSKMRQFVFVLSSKGIKKENLIKNKNK